MNYCAVCSYLVSRKKIELVGRVGYYSNYSVGLPGIYGSVYILGCTLRVSQCTPW